MENRGSPLLAAPEGALTLTQLSDVKVRNARAKPGERVELPDGNGLSLRISPDGRKAWSVSYRVAGNGPYDAELGRNRAGPKRRMNLGYWPDLTLAQARAAASAVRAQSLGGKDPRPVATAHPTTVADLIGTYCSNVKVKLLSEKQRLLERYVQPAWGSRELQTLSRGELAQLIQPLTPSRQFEVRKHVVAMFNWAADRGLVGSNPFAGMRLKIEMKPRERALTLREARIAFKTAGGMGYPFGTLYQLLLLTGCRLRELAEAKWGWIEGDELTVPGRSRKTGRPHVVPLSRQAQAILETMPRQQGPFLFSTTDGGRPVSGFSKAKHRLDALLGPEFPSFVIHDFRRTVRTQLSRAGVDAITAELILGHQLSGIMGVYDRYERLEERRLALQAWADELTQRNH